MRKSQIAIECAYRLPFSPTESYIITTRSKLVGEDLTDLCIEVPPFSLEEAKSLLQFNAKNAFVHSDLTVIERLLDILGYFP